MNLSTIAPQYQSTTPSPMDSSEGSEFLYTVLEAIVAIGAFVGNLLVVIVFIQDKRLRKVTNFYVISLAVADMLVGLIGIPSAILTRMGIPEDSLYLCLTMLSLLVVLCTISILNLLAVSLDRYWAILHPMDYHRRISEKTAMIIIVSCWIIGALIGFAPLYGWRGFETNKCFFIPHMDYNFLVFLYFFTIILPALMMAFFYARIYLVVMKQLSYKKAYRVPSCHYSHHSTNSNSLNGSERRRQKCEPSSLDSSIGDIASASDKNSNVAPMLPKSRSLTMLRNNIFNQSVRPIKLSYSKREVKKAQKLFIIVVYFMLCWIPLYTLNTVEAFCKEGCKPNRTLLDLFIILSHLNSVGSPFLYAFHMKDFREALRRLLCLCAIRQRQFREFRRQELFSITGVPVVGRRHHNNTLEMCANTFNTPEMTPELSPNPSLNKIPAVEYQT